MEKQYAKAIDLLVRERGMDEKELFEKLESHLKDRGRSKLLPQLLTELKRLKEQHADFHLSLEAATTEDAKDAETEANKKGITAKATLNPDLISGWRLLHRGTLIDRSGKRALVDLYRTITR